LRAVGCLKLCPVLTKPFTIAAADAAAAKSGNAHEWKQRVIDEAAKDEPKQKYTW